MCWNSVLRAGRNLIEIFLSKSKFRNLANTVSDSHPKTNNIISLIKLLPSWYIGTRAKTLIVY